MRELQLHSEQRGQTYLSYENYNNIIKVCKQFLSLQFNKSQFDVVNDGKTTRISLVNQESNSLSFDWTLGYNTADPKKQIISLKTGNFVVQGDDNYELAAADYELPAGVADDLCFPTISFVIATKTVSLKFTTAYPTMTADEALVPLIRLKYSTAWYLDGDGSVLHPGGDIHFTRSMLFG